MKYFVILPVLIVFSIGVLFSMENSYAMPPFSSQEVFDFSEIVAVGKVTNVNSTFSPTMNLYSIDVEKYLKNPQDSNVILATGSKTISVRGGNQVFDTGDRALFFLTNSSVGYDVHSGILNVHPVSKKIEPVWDKCNVFEKDIPTEHWVFGGTGVLPKISQGEKLDIDHFEDRNNFKVGKTVTISYDISNISDNSKVLELDGILSRSNGTEFEVMSTTSQHVVLEPCTVFKTIEWRFTPSMTGSYIFEIIDDFGTSYGLGFTIKESVDSPLAQIKSGITIDEIKCKDNLILIQKYDGSPACVTPETRGKLIERGWATCGDEVSHGRDHPCGPRSSTGIVNFNSEKYTEVSIITIPLGAVIEGHKYLSPDEITVVLGKNNTVTWVNEDDTVHRFNSNEGGANFWTTGMIYPNKESTVVFNQTGIFEYHGEPHPWMIGKVIVLENGNPEPVPVTENKKPYTLYDISGIKQIYMVGEPISFTETVQGYANPCVYPHYEILDGNTLETVWQYKIVYPCPFIKDPQQFKKTYTIPNDNTPSPILNQTGHYILRSYYSYSDGYKEVTFSVIDESIEERENEN